MAKRTFAQRYKAHPHRISARNPQAVKRALRTPGLRKSVPWKYLPPKARRQRRLQQPIMPGSAITKGQLRRETKAAATTKYGPLAGQQRQAIGEAKAYERDIGTYYDDYLRHVQQSSQRVRESGEAASQAIQGLQAGTTGLAAADLTGIQQPANKDAAARGATAGDVSGMASNAAAVRQALVASFGAQQARVNKGAQDFATHRADIIAPSQRLQGLAMAAGRTRQARENLAQTQRERGAFRQQYGAERKGEESKNILAMQALGLETAEKTRAHSEDVRAAKAGEAIDRAQIRATTQNAIRSANKSNSDVVTSGAFAGLTKAEVRALTPAQARQHIRRYNNSKGGGSGGGGGGADGKGPKLLTPGQSAGGLTQLGELKTLTSKAKAGQLFKKGTGNPPPLDRYKATQKVAGYAGSKLKHPSLARAAADAVYDGHISAFTEKQLRRAGYRPLDVAQALGVLTHSQHVKKYQSAERLRGHPH